MITGFFKLRASSISFSEYGCQVTPGPRNKNEPIRSVAKTIPAIPALVFSV
jgi:hypothetical protein